MRRAAARDLISKRTRNAFREFLVGWSVGDIRMLFEEVGIFPDLKHDPPERGDRRRFVEQHYHTLDVREPATARRLVSAYAEMLQRVIAKSGLSDSTTELVAALRQDGFIYENGSLRAASPMARIVLAEQSPRHTISEITRRAIAKEFSETLGGWNGELGEVELLSHLYDLDSMPSNDPRVRSMREDISMHREFNNDGSMDWVFWDERLNLLNAPDDDYLQFLSECLHPTARPTIGDGETIAARLNEHLVHDGWRLVPNGQVSKRPIFVARRESETIQLPASHATDVLSDQYVRELSEKCDARLSTDDLDGAVTVARTLLEAVLSELEFRLAGNRGDHKGDLPRQFKAVAKLLRIDDERPELDERFKDVVRGLVTIVSGVAPLRNRISDGHARARRPARHHARVVINASRTVVTFLVESYSYQHRRSV